MRQNSEGPTPPFDRRYMILLVGITGISLAIYQAHSTAATQKVEALKKPEQRINQQSLSNTAKEVRNITRPETGSSPWSDEFGFGVYKNASRNKIIVSAPEATDILFLLKRPNSGTVIRHEYIRANEVLTLVEIPNGKLAYQYVYGKNWSESKRSTQNGPVGFFTEAIGFVRPADDDMLTFPTDFEKTYSLEFQSILNGNLETVEINSDEFFDF